MRHRIQIMQVPADGSGEPAFIGLEADSLWSFDVSRDGSRISFDGTDYRISNPTTDAANKPE